MDDKKGDNKGEKGKQDKRRQSYSIFGFFPSSGVLGSRNTTFRKLDVSVLLHHKFHFTRPGLEPGPPRW
jgi:hypothetical protein